MTEDIRNGNGRTVKSRFATPNRVDRIDESIQAIFWIMKDDSLPPLVKINDPLMASTMGCTLMTKRSNAENVTGKHDDLVIEPYANPFRVYPLVEDYRKFRSLFESGVDCYIINTGFYMGKGISKEISLSIIEKIVDEEAIFKPFGSLEGFEYMECEGYPVPSFDSRYKQLIRERMQVRLNFLLAFNQKYPKTALPVDAISRLETVLQNLES
ncbi:hypothetical protein HMPREF9682_01041 [Streptococcus intermedius F0395]|uniref:Phosphoenolpyruvate carboxykinase n=1 Tax=Streptococcus constellatus subsp. pharyngis SK1060 = CCUG 46377 TaxID=1035184 RepID=F9P4P4_STRCV|nr:hypothetical protein HMPREF1042_0442 [Streptococcus constellatus subsp. pharyngis SK1060 = CCUG 46377]EHG13155.1 hypothetical protein HMPREF9682_01041 [Streptococcus intermedius F0395]